jgi:hypothetical protein
MCVYCKQYINGSRVCHDPFIEVRQRVIWLHVLSSLAQLENIYRGRVTKNVIQSVFQNHLPGDRDC